MSEMPKRLIWLQTISTGANNCLVVISKLFAGAYHHEISMIQFTKVSEMSDGV
jgi:hypothetical protein